MNFTDYCKQNNIKLLPDDIKFVRSRIYGLPKLHRKAAMKRYVEIWVEVLHNCENAIEAQNRARRAANLYLLEM